MKLSIAVVAALLLPSLAFAADPEAGKAKVATVCAACHGASGVSVSETIPNLAGQRAGYIEGQLKALKEGTRKNPIMNAIAAQLSAEDMSNVAAYFASLPGAAAGSKSAFLPNVAKTRVTFPEGYQGSYVKYMTMNFPAAKQVRHFYANPVALQAAREGKALPHGSVLFAEVYSAQLDGDKKPRVGADGFFVPDQIVGYTEMASGEGWGAEVPDMLRNADWNYAVFNAAKEHRPVNQAECFACHKPLESASYTFTLKQLAEVAQRK